MLEGKRLGIIGVGNMGEALLKGVLHGNLFGAEQILASSRTRERIDDVASRLGVETTLDNSLVAQRSDIVLFGVKPQQMDAVVGTVRESFRSDQLIISIAAGVTTRHIEDLIGLPIPVMRVMPNTPALIGAGVSAYCRGRYAIAEHAQMTHAILNVVGEALEATEDLMDPITAVSGTGPAYIFYTLEAMLRGAIELGLPTNMARALVKHTALGAARLVMDSEELPGELRARVTSKGGTTEAALNHLESQPYQAALCDAMEKACARARELGDGG